MYDVIILATEKNIPTLRISLPYIKKNLDYKSVFVITSPNNQYLIESIGAVFVDESSVYQGLSLDSVADIIENVTGERKRAGWYLQQFLKMAWCYKCDDSYYVVFDADTIPLHHIEYIDINNRYLLNVKREFHKPYFDCLAKLFNGDIYRIGNYSFIAENMIFDVKIMKQLLYDIELNDSLKGNLFFEKILYSVNADEILASGFSEFETYGNYIAIKYGEKIRIRKLDTLRESLQLLGCNPSRQQLDWAARDYDIISIESSIYKQTILTKLTSLALFRLLFSMRTIAKIRTVIRTVHRKLLHKEDFIFD